MSALALLENLQGRGFTLSATGSDLYVAPRAALTFNDRVAIRDNKVALLELMGAQFAEPHITESGELRIPFDAHPRYHWWKGGQPVVVTLAELNARAETWRRYAARGPHPLMLKHGDFCAGAVERAGEVVYCAQCKYFMEVE